MELIPTYLSVIENISVSLIFGASTMAVISYALVMKFGYPQRDFGVYMSRCVYALLRLSHLLVAVIFLLNLLVFGLLDGILEAQVEYGIKMFVVLINFFLLYLINFKGYSLHLFIPLVTGGWFFLSFFHSYSNFVVIINTFPALFFYVLSLIAFHFLFVFLRKIMTKGYKG